jgi:hypothetical protein
VNPAYRLALTCACLPLAETLLKNKSAVELVIEIGISIMVCFASGWQIEEAKLFRAQGQNEMAINLGIYISENYQSNKEASDVYRLIGKWLAETRSSKLLNKLILFNF